jgi:hypothetical protein
MTTKSLDEFLRELEKINSKTIVEKNRLKKIKKLFLKIIMGIVLMGIIIYIVPWTYHFIGGGGQICIYAAIAIVTALVVWGFIVEDSSQWVSLENALVKKASKAILKLLEKDEISEEEEWAMNAFIPSERGIDKKDLKDSINLLTTEEIESYKAQLNKLKR